MAMMARFTDHSPSCVRMPDRIAGMPQAVVKRADQILQNLEANDLDVNAPKIVRKPRRKLSDLPGQMTLF